MMQESVAQFAKQDRLVSHTHRYLTSPRNKTEVKMSMTSVDTLGALKEGGITHPKYAACKPDDRALLMPRVFWKCLFSVSSRP